MTTKLTLRLDEKLIDRAKKAAKVKGVSLSKFVSDYFKSVSSKQTQEHAVSPVLSEISGILLSKSENKKLLKSYKKHIEEKYR